MDVSEESNGTVNLVPNGSSSQVHQKLDYSLIRPPAYTVEDLERDAARGAEVVQAEVLRAILAVNEETEYLRSYKLGGNSTPDEFRAAHPLTTYSHFRSWIEKEAARKASSEEPKVLCEEEITHFLLTSGTTNMRKIYPETVGSLTRATRLITLGASLFTRFFGAESNAYALRLVHMSQPQTLPGGLLAYPLVPSLTKFGLEKFPDTALKTQCSPLEVYKLTDNRQATYCHMLCALAGWNKLTQMRTSFAASFVVAFHTLERDWETFVEDIRTGTVNRHVVESEVLREQVGARIGANPKRADELRAEFGKGFEGIIPRVWPNVRFLESILTGPMEPYLEPLRRYAGPDLPLVTLTYGSTEAFIGINVDLSDPNPRSSRYTILPREAFWEFIPVEAAGEDNPSTLVRLHELEMGRCYEVVLTNWSGLYRYRLEDVVRVEGFLHSLPQVSFQYRRGVLAIQGANEHVTERDLAAAVSQTAQLLAPLGKTLTEYTSAIDLVCVPPRYTIFWELAPLPGSTETELDGGVQCLENLAAALDDAIQRQNGSYGDSRSVKHELSPVELCVVRGETFHELFKYREERGAHAGQYKVPRCLKTEDVKDIFRRNVLQSSARDSTWVKQ